MVAVITITSKRRIIMQQKNGWLNIGWKIMLAWGIMTIFFAFFVPLLSYLALPNQPMTTYMADDAKFTGVAWDKIAALSPELGLWIVMLMTSMCAILMGWGIMAMYLSKEAYRRGERWAWRALLGGYGTSFILYQAILTFPYFSRGLYGLSSVSLGLPFAIFAVLIFIFGLWLPRKELTP